MIKKAEGEILSQKAEEAINEAVRGVIIDRKMRGEPLIIWENGRVVKIPSRRLPQYANYPIGIFYREIITIIEQEFDVTIKEHKENIKLGLVHPEIVITTREKIKNGGVSCDLITKKIIFQEAFLGFLWAIIYSLYFFYEKFYIKLANGKFHKQNVSFSEEEKAYLKGSEDLFFWALSLKKKFSEWPDNLVPSKLDKEFQVKTKIIWKRAASFIFYHEYAHLIFNHNEKNKENEKIADSYAFRRCLPQNVFKDQSNEIRKINLLGILSGVVGSLFIVKSKRQAFTDTHLDVDERINIFLQYAEFDIKEKEDVIRYIKMFSSIGCKIFLNKILNQNFEFHSEDPNQIWNECLKKFDELKKS